MAKGWIADSRDKMEKNHTKGSFTKYARERGKTPTEEADTVMAHTDRYPTKIVRKANWMRNVNG